MSNFNIDWIKQNFNESLVIYYIGAAGLNEVVELRKSLPNANLFAFECGNYWIDTHPIYDIAKEYKINYHHTAVSDIDGEIQFYPCVKNRDADWPVSSSMFEATELLGSLKFAPPVTVESTTLEKFCLTYSCPDFIHIDVQGAEYKVFSRLGPCRPKAIWTEVCEFHRYNTGVTYEDFFRLMQEIGYKKHYIDGPDELFVLEDFYCTEYKKKVKI